MTPLSPTDWKLIFDGESISLDPSIGNRSFARKSHYWIRRNKVRWDDRWSQDEIDAVRFHERLVKENYYASEKQNATSRAGKAPKDQPAQVKAGKSRRGFWWKPWEWWS